MSVAAAGSSVVFIIVTMRESDKMISGSSQGLKFCSFIKCLLSMYCMQSTLLEAEDTAVKEKNLCIHICGGRGAI